MILAVTYPGDEHAAPLLDALARRGAEVAVLDTSELPRRGAVALAYGGSHTRQIRLDGRSPLEAERISAVWWRRPLPLRASRRLGRAHAAFAVRQAGDALMGFFALLERHALFVNHPWRGEMAGLKTFQLAIAERAALLVPATLVTSDPLEARAFLASCGRAGAVHKALHSSPADWRRARRVTPGDRARLGIIRHAPLILQRHIPGVDVRVTLVGDQVFAAEIDARRSSSPDDYRGVESQCRFAPCALPAKVERGLCRLRRDLGLVFGAADLRRSDDGSWYFLEMNPSGQWGFVEERTGQPITAALAELLARGDRGAFEPARDRSPG
ncbi:MAG TPA: alpha-L-glutamate ligase [Anaeromyxobacter sp.]|nr:alpha-L-glutamate ligase [Anaeromyxobacter sp.]